MVDARRTFFQLWMLDARCTVEFGCPMPDARRNSDARCSMHRCTRNFSFQRNQRKSKRFEQTSFLGKQKTSLYVWKRSTLQKKMWEKKKDWWYFKRSKKKATSVIKNSRLSSAFFLYRTIIRVTILWKSLKQTTIWIRQYFAEDLIFAEKRLFVWLKQKVFWELIFAEKRIFVWLEQKVFWDLIFDEKRIFVWFEQKIFWDLIFAKKDYSFRWLKKKGVVFCFCCFCCGCFYCWLKMMFLSTLFSCVD